MKVERYVGEGFAANTYLVDLGGGSIMIDASCAYSFIKKKLTSPLLAVFITHAHADHIQHLADVLEATSVPVAAHRRAFEIMASTQENLSAPFGFPFTVKVPATRRMVLYDGAKVVLCENEIRVLATPGHSDDSLSFIIDHELFTGDTLFCGSVGRSDLANSNAADLLKSLNLIKSLKGDYLIHPGHDEETTLEEECAHNPWLGGRSIYD